MTRLTSLSEDRRAAGKSGGSNGEQTVQPKTFQRHSCGWDLDVTSGVLRAESHDPRSSNSNTEKLSIMADMPGYGRRASNGQNFQRKKANYRKSKEHSP